MYAISNRRYTGSKLKLAGWIIDKIKANCTGSSFFEIFAGTSVISSNIAPYMKRIILNDTLESNNIIYRAFYAHGNFSWDTLLKYKQKFLTLNNAKLTTGYFTKNYGGKYFGNIDCKNIEAIRNTIKKNRNRLTEKEYSILFASLIYSMDKCANTVGHFDAYFRKNVTDGRFVFDIIEPMNFPDTYIDIYCEDANTLAPKIDADIVYIDPPYNSRQYCQFYHIYETLVRWDEPELFGVALKPAGKHLSDYCRNKAPEVFSDLLSKLNSRYIVVSYNNTYNSKSSSSRNKITLHQLKQMLSQYGNVKTFSKKHRFFNAGKTDFRNHKEYLFVTEVRK
ncbi:MAG: DNA adenine methylase [Treponema sp.]|nr:DNA adenine methylase [Treponema sp.]